MFDFTLLFDNIETLLAVTFVCVAMMLMYVLKLRAEEYDRLFDKYKAGTTLGWFDYRGRRYCVHIYGIDTQTKTISYAFVRDPMGVTPIVDNKTILTADAIVFDSTVMSMYNRIKADDFGRTWTVTLDSNDTKEL